MCGDPSGSTKPNRHGFYTQSFSTRWARFADRIGINDLRKVFIDACRAKRLPEFGREGACWPRYGEVHAVYGSEGYPLNVLANAIRLVSYPGLDFMAP